MATVNLGRVVGYSAYEIAVQQGYVGTEAEWIASLKGRDGVDGTVSFEELTPEQKEEIRGPQGIKGDKGDKFEYSDFTPEELEALRGPEGPVGPKGEDGVTAIDDGVIEYTSTWSSRHIFNENDKIMSRVRDIEEAKVPNVIIYGAPTINGAQMSGFSTMDYAKFPFLVSLTHPFEINFSLTTGDDVMSQQNILDSDYGLAFAIRSGKFVMALSTNGTSWDLGEGVGVLDVQPNTSYMLKIEWTGNNYAVRYSMDGGMSYSYDIIISSMMSLFPRQIYIGVGQSGDMIMNSFGGVIDFRSASLKMNNVFIWLGYDDIGLLTRMSTDMANIDEDGIAKINSLIDAKLEVVENGSY